MTAEDLLLHLETDRLVAHRKRGFLDGDQMASLFQVANLMSCPTPAATGKASKFRVASLCTNMEFNPAPPPPGALLKYVHFH